MFIKNRTGFRTAKVWHFFDKIDRLNKISLKLIGGMNCNLKSIFALVNVILLLK